MPATLPAPGASVLLVEDEATLARAIGYTLEREGYRVALAPDGAGALRLFRSAPPDIVLLDLMLPGVNGLQVCAAIRETSRVPIMMITARDAERDKVIGLELGADDYLTKPFGMRELIARVRALLRRAAPAGAVEDGRVVTAGPLRIMPGQRRVFRDDAEVLLRRREFDLLLFLARHPGQVFSRDQLLERVWGHDFEGEPRTVDVHVRMLRQKIEQNPENPQLIHTVRQVGYTFRAAASPPA
jgi:DNA-binding response OmpR family regulator